MLFKDLLDIAASWDTFGMHVGVPMKDIERISTNVNRMAKLTAFCFPRVIDAWLKRGQADRKTLVDAVRHLGKRNLADEINDDNGM